MLQIALKDIYMVKCIWEKWHAKVRNHNLRGSDIEMNMNVLNFIEINKRSGWKLVPLRKKVMIGSVHGC